MRLLNPSKTSWLGISQAFIILATTNASPFGRGWMRRGEFASDDEIAALYNRHRE